MKIALASLICVPGIDQSNKDGQNIRGCGQEKRDDIIVSQSSDHSREEVGYTAAGNDAEEHNGLVSGGVVFSC